MPNHTDPVTPTPPTQAEGLRVVSYGGGVQSTALLVLAAQRRIDFPTFLFANVGDDSEHPATLDYVRNVAIPYGAEHGIAVHELHATLRGEPIDLRALILRRDRKSIRIPVRGRDTGAPGKRSCTKDYKRVPIGKWLKAHGASADDPATVGIGFSTDEAHRATNRPGEDYERPTWPLLDLRMSRQDCIALIERSGLPVPPKSACYFCPFHRPQVWAEMRRDEPELFWKSVELERVINDKRPDKDPMYLTRFGKPLDEAIGEAQQTLFSSVEGPETCDDGYCWT
jgi:hypothetical protein